MKKTIVLLTTTMVLLASVVLSHSQERPQGITLTEAIAIATEKIPGEVIRTERERGLYEIKIRTADGRIEKVYLDALTGDLAGKEAITLDEATAIATEAVPGDVIKVEFERGNYEVKIRTTNGLRKEVYIDGRSGEVLKIKRD
ncbi:MAG: PepSY domain-containing protein [Proteobacteria bacterium]|nr:PepSY domain-containing protein [Pseudomonadota bacterium]